MPGTRHSNLYQKANQTVDNDLRNQMYERADQLGVDDAVMMNLFHDKQFRLIQPYVHNFPQNAMEYRVLRETWLEPHKN